MSRAIVAARPVASSLSKEQCAEGIPPPERCLETAGEQDEVDHQYGGDADQSEFVTETGGDEVGIGQRHKVRTPAPSPAPPIPPVPHGVSNLVARAGVVGMDRPTPRHAPVRWPRTDSNVKISNGRRLRLGGYTRAPRPYTRYKMATMTAITMTAWMNAPRWSTKNPSIQNTSKMAAIVSNIWSPFGRR